MQEAFMSVRHGGVTLCTQAFGQPGDPAILLLMGATASMLWWPDPLCRMLASGGHHVIRFDHRDTGASTTLPPGQAAYGVADMADDALAILDAYGVQRAHLVGMSLGGYIAQLLALRNPQRVDRLTLISAEPLGGETLPPLDMSPAFLEHMGKMETMDWSDPTAVHAFLERSAALSSSPARGYDHAETAERITREMGRTSSIRSAFNHATVGGDLSAYDLRNIAVPTQVIHGAHDPIIPLLHGQAIARQIPGARLAVLPQAGHELHTDDLREIASLVLR